MKKSIPWKTNSAIMRKEVVIQAFILHKDRQGRKNLNNKKNSLPINLRIFLLSLAIFKSWCSMHRNLLFI